MKSSPAGSSTYAESAWYQVLALESICPHDGVGGVTPMPRKDRPASETMLLGSEIAEYVSTGATRAGRSSRRAVRHGLDPASREAATKSRDFKVSTWARTILAMPPQPSSPSTSISSRGRGKPLGMIASSAMAKTSDGRVTKMSVIRLTRPSRKRLPSPASSPKSMPSPTCSAVAPIATTSEIRAP